MGDLEFDLLLDLGRHVLMRVASTPEAIIQFYAARRGDKAGKGPPPDSDLFDVEKI